MVDTCKCSITAWKNVASKVNKAVVFIDGPSAESLHWTSGGLLLYHAGAAELKEFSSFESGGPEHRKAVFIISSPLEGMTINILRDIVKASSFQYVIVFSSLCGAMHTIVNHGRGDDSSRTFLEVEDQLLEWMGNKNFTVEISYQPVVFAPITPTLFVLPAHHQAFPLLPSDLDSLLPKVTMENKGGSGRTIQDLNFGHLPKELQLSLKLLVCSLDALLENLSLTEDIYGLGHTSRILAAELASLPWAKQRRKNAQRKASLLLIDRTLDIPNVIGHHWETIFDRILSLLPKLSQHNNDVCVNMNPVCSVIGNPDHEVIVPGCLAHPEDPSASLLHKFTINKHKESLMEVNRQLVEAASRENLPIKLTGRPGKITAEQLESHLAHFKGNTKAVKKNRGLLQLVLAVVQTLRHTDSSRLDSLYGVEKALLQGVGEEEGPSPLTQILQLMQKEKSLPSEERTFRLEDFFILLVFLYSLLDEQQDVEFMTTERKLQGLLMDFILEEPDKLPAFFKDLVEDDPQKETLVLILQDLFDRLKALMRTRENLIQFESVYSPGNVISPTALKPLCKTVIETIFDPSKPDLQDFVYQSTGFRDLLKSGFGLFMNVSKPRPSDHPLLIVFIMGGTTSTEVKQITEAVTASKSNIQVLIGSTKLLSSSDLLHQVLVADHLHPKS